MNDDDIQTYSLNPENKETLSSSINEYINNSGDNSVISKWYYKDSTTTDNTNFDMNNIIWTATSTDYPSQFNIKEMIENEIKDENIDKDISVLGTIFLMDGWIYLHVSKDKSIKLGKFGGEGIGKKISREVTKKKLKEE